ncbi:MAG: hypothetical protein GKS07_00880 [Nitrosopumilus sp.]|nr:MAG: hypothetical protein GKS07_00880 [Nitrosopumilus sp.]
MVLKVIQVSPTIPSPQSIDVIPIYHGDRIKVILCNLKSNLNHNIIHEIVNH